jgi:hypothetical protein
LEIILCLACFVLVIINLQLIFRFELYESYSTGCIFMLLSVTMVLRIIYLIYAITVLESRSALFIELIVLAPNFLMTMVSLSFYTQWLETYHFLKRIQLFNRLKEQGVYSKILYFSHAFCLLLYVLDIIPRIVSASHK